MNERTNERTNEQESVVCRVKMSSGMPCIGVAGPSGYCHVHEKYTEAGADTRCAKCQKKIRTGSMAMKRADGRELSGIGAHEETGHDDDAG